MDFNLAKNILLLPDKFDEKMIKKQYRIMALKNHPDKNNGDVQYNEKFAQINEAYEFLMNYKKTPVDSSSKNTDFTYDFIFNNFVKSLFDDYIQSDILIKIVEHIVLNGSGFNKSYIAKDLLSKISNETLIHMYDVLCKYKDLFHIDNDTLKYIQSIINDRIKEDLIIVLNPSLDDLLNDNIYVLQHENDKFYIPLWHNELHYEIEIPTLHTLIVMCKPELPSNVELNSEGDLVVIVREKIEKILINKELCIELNNKKFNIPSENLKIQTHQHYLLKNQGVSHINSGNIYDNKCRGHIHLLIELF